MSWTTKLAVAILFGQAKGWNNPQATCHQRRRESEGVRGMPLVKFLWPCRQGQHHKKKIKQRFYWPDYYKDIVEMVRHFKSKVVYLTCCVVLDHMANFNLSLARFY